MEATAPSQAARGTTSKTVTITTAPSSTTHEALPRLASHTSRVHEAARIVKQSAFTLAYALWTLAWAVPADILALVDGLWDGITNWRRPSSAPFRPFSDWDGGRPCRCFESRGSSSADDGYVTAAEHPTPPVRPEASVARVKEPNAVPLPSSASSTEDECRSGQASGGCGSWSGKSKCTTDVGDPGPAEHLAESIDPVKEPNEASGAAEKLVDTPPALTQPDGHPTTTKQPIKPPRSTECDTRLPRELADLDLYEAAMIPGETMEFVCVVYDKATNQWKLHSGTTRSTNSQLSRLQSRDERVLLICSKSLLRTMSLGESRKSMLTVKNKKDGPISIHQTLVNRLHRGHGVLGFHTGELSKLRLFSHDVLHIHNLKDFLVIAAGDIEAVKGASGGPIRSWLITTRKLLSIVDNDATHATCKQAFWQLRHLGFVKTVYLQLWDSDDWGPANDIDDIEISDVESWIQDHSGPLRRGLYKDVMKSLRFLLEPLFAAVSKVSSLGLEIRIMSHKDRTAPKSIEILQEKGRTNIDPVLPSLRRSRTPIDPVYLGKTPPEGSLLPLRRFPKGSHQMPDAVSRLRESVGFGNNDMHSAAARYGTGRVAGDRVLSMGGPRSKGAMDQDTTPTESCTTGSAVSKDTPRQTAEVFFAANLNNAEPNHMSRRPGSCQIVGSSIGAYSSTIKDGLSEASSSPVLDLDEDLSGVSITSVPMQALSPAEDRAPRSPLYILDRCASPSSPNTVIRDPDPSSAFPAPHPSTPSAIAFEDSTAPPISLPPVAVSQESLLPPASTPAISSEENSDPASSDTIKSAHDSETMRNALMDEGGSSPAPNSLGSEPQIPFDSIQELLSSGLASPPVSRFPPPRCVALCDFDVPTTEIKMSTPVATLGEGAVPREAGRPAAGPIHELEPAVPAPCYSGPGLAKPALRPRKASRPLFDFFSEYTEESLPWYSTAQASSGTPRLPRPTPTSDVSAASQSKSISPEMGKCGRVPPLAGEAIQSTTSGTSKPPPAPVLKFVSTPQIPQTSSSRVSHTMRYPFHPLRSEGPAASASAGLGEEKIEGAFRGQLDNIASLGPGNSRASTAQYGRWSASPSSPLSNAPLCPGHDEGEGEKARWSFKTSPASQSRSAKKSTSLSVTSAPSGRKGSIEVPEDSKPLESKEELPLKSREESPCEIKEEVSFVTNEELFSKSREELLKSREELRRAELRGSGSESVHLVRENGDQIDEGSAAENAGGKGKYAMYLGVA